MSALRRVIRLLPYTAVGTASLLAAALIAALGVEAPDTALGAAFRALGGILVLPAYIAGLIGSSALGFLFGTDAGASLAAVYGGALAVCLAADGGRAVWYRVRHGGGPSPKARDAAGDGANGAS